MAHYYLPIGYYYQRLAYHRGGGGTDSDNIDFRCIYDSNANLISQNRSNFESTDQTSIDQAINVLEDLDPDELNFDGIAIEETMQNEGITVLEETEHLVDNPGYQVWDVDPATNTAPGGFFNVPSRMSEDEFLDLCRRLNLIQCRIFLHTLHCFKTNKNSLCTCTLEEVLVWVRVR